MSEADGAAAPAEALDRRFARSREGTQIKEEDFRSETERDRGRLQYSPYLRRLAGVTQVVSPELTNSKLHSRASHTYKVAMISREIGESLERRAEREPQVAEAIASAGGLDVTACEVAGLAHDLGHPPFGHAGESELNRLLRKNGVREGFEGNAQSFRIVCALDWHDYDRGLNLTNVVLAAILKYPWLRPEDERAEGKKPDVGAQSKFGAYESEAAHLKRAREAVLPHIDDDALLSAGKKPPQSLEASVMDLADDIAYSIHDLEDFCSQGFIDLSVAVDSLGQFVAKPHDLNNAFATATIKLRKFSSEFDHDEYVKAAGRVRVLLDNINTPAWSQSARDQQLRGDLSAKVAEFFGAITLSSADGAPTVSLLSPRWHDMQVMKRVTKHFLVGTSRMGQIQRAQRQTIERLFHGLVEWIGRVDGDEELPETLREFMAIQGLGLPGTAGPEAGHLRAIVDYICTMSDSEAFLRAQWITGTEIPGMANLGLVN